MLDYEILRLLWWAVLGVLLIGIAVMDGFDMGSAILLPFVGRGDSERRVVINTVGPVWEGNQEWLILRGGGFKFRSKIADPRWRATWDYALSIGGLVPALVFGVAFGNVLQGVPFRFDDTLRVTYTGSLLGLFNPFALLCGVISVAMIAVHGATWLAGKTLGGVQDRSRRAGVWLALATVALFAVAGLWASYIDGNVVTVSAGPDGPSNPLGKTVVRASGALLASYHRHPWMMLAPALGLVGPLLTAFWLMLRKPGLAWLTRALSIAGIIGTAGVSLFPFLLP